MPPPFGKLSKHKAQENVAINPFNLDHEFASGKYKGHTVQEVIEIDRSYITWCMENLKGWELDNEAYEYYMRMR